MVGRIMRIIPLRPHRFQGVITLMPGTQFRQRCLRVDVLPVCDACRNTVTRMCEFLIWSIYLISRLYWQNDHLPRHKKLLENIYLTTGLGLISFFPTMFVYYCNKIYQPPLRDSTRTFFVFCHSCIQGTFSKPSRKYTLPLVILRIREDICVSCV